MVTDPALPKVSPEFAASAISCLPRKTRVVPNAACGGIETAAISFSSTLGLPTDAATIDGGLIIPRELTKTAFWPKSEAGGMIPKPRSVLSEFQTWTNLE